MYRTHTCGELRINDISKEVTLAGWVQTVRKFGAITFDDLLLVFDDLSNELDDGIQQITIGQ